MDSEKRQAIQKKLKDFISMKPEEKHSIDNDVKYDGLFDTIHEMSDIVESNYDK